MEKIYIDTNIFVYFLTASTIHGPESRKVFERCKEGKIDAWTSVFTFVEINSALKILGFSKKEITASLQRALNLDIKMLSLKEDYMMLVPVVMSEGFSFGDSIHIVTMKENGIKTIVSNDPDFERAGFRRVFV